MAVTASSNCPFVTWGGVTWTEVIIHGMSWDITILDGDGAEVADVGNYTTNCLPMLRDAVEATGGMRLLRGGLRGLSGMDCRTVLGILYPAMVYWDDHRDEMEKLDPGNLWGDEPSARAFYWAAIKACARWPDGRFRID